MYRGKSYGEWYFRSKTNKVFLCWLQLVRFDNNADNCLHLRNKQLDHHRLLSK